MDPLVALCHLSIELLWHVQRAAILCGPQAHLADAHRGKGAGVREAWALHPEDDFLAFVDAEYDQLLARAAATIGDPEYNEILDPACIAPAL